MPEITTLIVDDEPLVREGLRGCCHRDGRLTVIGEARAGAEAVAMIRRHTPDLLLLDVQMPELDGFGVLEALGDAAPPAVVFITAYERYAIRAFDLHAVDYLLKPFDEERFTTAATRAIARVGAGRRDWTPVVADARAGSRRLLVREEGRTVIVPVEDVDWIEAADNYVKLHTARRTWMLREAMRYLEQQLAPQGFARVHRSAMVNLSRVREVQPLFGGESVILLATGTRVTLSRGYRDHFRGRLATG
ncbi:MAG: response regulator transcription factor [Gemmatimonadetes bacterium]|nr:response regulator transcription factor [Gemmatimonadota bacterium]